MHVPKGIGHLKSLCRSICDICDLLSEALSTQQVGDLNMRLRSTQKAHFTYRRGTIWPNV